MSKKRTWSDDALKTAVSESTCLSSVILKLGLRAAGGNFKSIKDHINRMKLDTSHFTMDDQLKGLRSFDESRRLTEERVLVEKSSVKGSPLRRFILKNRLLTYKCSECGNAGHHNNKELTLQLDHINGVFNDNRLSNLRFLCPNCHSQTPTFGRKTRTGIVQ